MYNKWLEAYPNATDAVYDYDRMKEIEKYTDYQFSNTVKAETLVKEVAEESIYTFNSINSVFSDIGNGIQSGAKTLKFLPLVFVGVGSLILLKNFKVI